MLSQLLDSLDRTAKPRTEGITIALDKGVGTRAVRDLGETAGHAVDYAKIAWGSSLITANLADKVKAYREAGIEPLLGGTLFEYCYLRDRADTLLALATEHRLHVEISDGVIGLSRKDKLRWIERFAATGGVFSEVGAKTETQDLNWELEVQEELDAGSTMVVIEGRQIGPVGQELRTDIVDRLLSAFPSGKLVFEALERYQQVWFIKRIGTNVNLGNILVKDVLTLESFRLGLKEHTLLHFHQKDDTKS